MCVTILEVPDQGKQNSMLSIPIENQNIMVIGTQLE